MSLGIVLLLISALSQIDLSNFTFQRAAFSMTKSAALLLAAYTLWSKRTAERLKDRRVVKNMRLLLTLLLVIGFLQISSGLDFSHFTFTLAGYEITLLALILLSLIVMWTSSVDNLRLRD